MPIETKGNQIRVRVADPDDFEISSFRTKTIDAGKGISIVIGKKQDGDSMETQSYRFDTDKGWVENTVKEWLKEHKVEYIDNRTDLTFAELNDVEIFATGSWNGHTITDADLDDIISSYNEIGNNIKPYVKLGHDDNQKLLQSDGYPSAGWISGLKKTGNKLIASIKDVPKVVADLISKGAYRRVSSEIYKNYKSQDGKQYPSVLKAIALLGSDTPAVTSLKDVLSLYSVNNDNDLTIYNYNYKEENNMNKNEEKEAKDINININGNTGSQVDFSQKEAELKELEAGLKLREAEINGKLEKYNSLAEGLEKFANADDLVEFAKKLKEQKESLDVLTEKYTSVVLETRANNINNFLEKKITENKILPKHKELLSKLLFALDDNTTTITFTDANLFGLKAENNLKEVLEKFIDTLPDMSYFKEFTSTKEVLSKDEEFNSLVENYMSKNKVSYGDAQLAVSKMRPDLLNIT